MYLFVFDLVKHPRIASCTEGCTLTLIGQKDTWRYKLQAPNFYSDLEAPNFYLALFVNRPLSLKETSKVSSLSLLLFNHKLCFQGTGLIKL